MSTQLLFYERITPVSPQRHGDWAVEIGKHYDFARKVNSVPLMAVEIPAAAREYTVVFTAAEQSIMPVVILGVEGQENLYVNANSEWEGQYVPAFVRRYPFVFSRSDDGGSFTLCVDESWSGCNQEGRGERLFSDDGARTDYLEKVLGFLQDYQTQFRRTQAFCDKLKELDLLEGMQAQFKLADGAERSLTGFQAVSRERLKALPADTLAELIATDEMELIYIHLQSMSNFEAMRKRVDERHASTAGKSGGGNGKDSAAGKDTGAAETPASGGEASVAETPAARQEADTPAGQDKTKTTDQDKTKTAGQDKAKTAGTGAGKTEIGTEDK
jgi:hypothetical protein